ncbi:hypothetical protein QUF61_17340 [Candidatus Venteria ishoeyi]|uniref:hypothetical protein n=1 Tax=Candidatus Venteria ishoeyi TaxID=1899563 RepID=UPI0025A5E9F6|nr:hypothetical protein [Candidatus Venteria ishoeyi]MDM8548258.1 hypothetical protein [Candidatus Venteria ishoeyi]
MNYKNLLVEIFVDVGGEGYIATAYPVAFNRVITVHHALYPDGKQPVSIELRWHHQKGKTRDWQALELADCIVWENKELDVALLRCEFPVKGSARLSHKKPAGNEHWQSEGFPAAGERDDNLREAVGLQGKTYQAAETQDWFELGVDNPVKQAKLWEGASGSPVFVDNEIIGIITSFQKPFGGNRFKATPAWKLLDIPEFRQKLCEEIDEDQEREQRWQWALEEITTLLEEQGANSPLLKQLRDRLDFDIELDTEPQHISERLLDDCALSERLDLLNELRVRFQKQKDDSGVACIRSLLNILLPALFGHRLIALLRNQKDSLTHLAFTAEIATETAAEIIMAGGDDRAVKFEMLEQENELPRGKFNHDNELPPEGGFRNKTKDSYIRDFQAHIIKTFAPGRISDSAALRIRQLATRSYGKQTQYCTYKIPDKEADKKHFTELIAEIQTKYPYLVFINLDTDEARYLEEIDNMYKVSDMQELKPPSKNTENAS